MAGRLRGIVTASRTSRRPLPHGGRALPVAAAVSLALLASGCAGTTRRSTTVSDPGVTARGVAAPASAGPAPSWSMLPTSWGKLTEIERWMADHQSRRGFWAVEANLQLAEGRLTFASERLDPGTPGSIVDYRRTAALEGFERVLATPEATADQRARARRGAERAGVEPTATAAMPLPELGGLIRRSTWRARRADRRNLDRASGPWRWITVHHSVVRTSDSSAASTFDTVRGIQRDHMDTKGWGDVGYHFLIDPSGRVIEGRELLWQGAHAGGANNVGNVGICLLGNFDVERPSRAAINSLDRLVLELQRKLMIPRMNVRPHRAWKETACPGQHLMPWFTRG